MKWWTIFGLVLWPAPVAAQVIENIGQGGQIVFGVERVTGVFVDTVTVEDEVEQVTINPVTGETIVTTRTREETVSATTVALFGMQGGGSLSATTPTAWASAPRLALDFFPIDGLSLGGSFVYLTRSGEIDIEDQPSDDLPTASTLIVAPRIGYAVPFDETVGIWPRAGVAYQRDELHVEGEVERRVALSSTNIMLEAVLFVSPMQHFALLFAPYAEIGVGGTLLQESDAPGVEDRELDAKATSLGVWAGVVGYY